jgi:hypothetical protein
MASIRDIFVRLGVKTDPGGFQKAESGINRITNAAKLAVTALASFKGIQLIKGIADETRELGDRLDKTSQQIGVTTDALQELEFAAGLAGASSADLKTGLRILARNANEAAQGSKEFADDFERLGVRVQDSNGQLKSTDQLLTELADGMAGLTSSTERTALAQSLLGRSGATLLPLLTQGTKRIKEQRQEARALGILDQDLIKVSVDLTDNQLRLSRAYAAIKLTIAKELLPAMNSVTKGTIAFIQQNKELIRQRLASFFSRVIRVVSNFATLVRDVTSRVVDWVRGLDDVSTGFLKLAGIVSAFALILALPGGSILLLLFLLAILIDDFMTFKKGGESATGDLVKAFQDFAAEFPNLSTAITDYLGVFISAFDFMFNTAASFMAFFVELFTVGPEEAMRNLSDRIMQVFRDLFGEDSAIFQMFDFFVSAMGGFFELIGGIAGTTVGLIFNLFQKLFEGDLVGMLDSFKVFVDEIFNTVGDAIKAPLDKFSDLAETVAGAFGFGEVAAQTPAAIPAAVGGAVAAPAGRGTVVNQRTTTSVNVEVRAAPGMDEKQLAEFTGKEVTRKLEAERRQAARSFQVEAL